MAKILREIQTDLEKVAEMLRHPLKDEEGNIIEYLSYKDCNPSQLANGYCDADEAGDDSLRDKYWSALLLRYWYKIFEWIGNSYSLGLEQVEYFNWLNEAVADAFYYRSWRPKRQDHSDKTTPWITHPWIDNPQYRPEDAFAADRSIHYFLGAKRGKEYQLANKHKRRGNYQTLSIDSTFDEEGYYILDVAGLSEKPKVYDGIKELINTFLSKNKPIEAIVIDALCYGESYKTQSKKVVEQEYDEETGEMVEKKYKTYSHTFDPRRLVKCLNSIDEDYFKTYFTKRYEMEDYQPALEELKSSNNGKLYKAIERTLETIKQSPELLVCLSQ